MNLTPIGAKTAMLGTPEKQQVANALIAGTNISSYTNGICFETVAYVRYLLNANINPSELTHLQSDDWVRKFDFTNGSKWNGRTAIPAGTAVGFYRLIDKKVFHAAIGTGDTFIRAVNGHRLGLGWDLLNLRSVLGEVNDDGSFNYDGTKIEVYLSNL